jgi:hypothetical protein
LHKLEKAFTAKLSADGRIKNIYAMLVGDILIIANNYASRKEPTKVICLDGLNMTETRD